MAQKKKMNKTSLVTAALVAALPFLSDLIIFGTTGRGDRIFSEAGILFFNAAFAAAPFIVIGLVMAARKSVTRALWVGAVLTALVWAAYAGSGWNYYVNETGGGANIGLFMILMIWPFIVAIIMGVIGKYEPHKVD